MKKYFILLIGIFYVFNAQCQIKSDTSLKIKEIARDNKSEFLVTSGGYNYYLTFVKTNNAKDSLYVALNSKTKYILQTEIEILDTLELEDILFNGKPAVLIRTGGNILLMHVLVLNKKKVKLFEKIHSRGNRY